MAGLSYAAVAAAAAAAVPTRRTSPEAFVRDLREAGAPRPLPPSTVRTGSRRQVPTHRTSSTVRSTETGSAQGGNRQRMAGGVAGFPPASSSWLATETTAAGRGGRPSQGRSRTETYASFFKTQSSVRKPPSPAVGARDVQRGTAKEGPPLQPGRRLSSKPILPKDSNSSFLASRNKVDPPSQTLHSQHRAVTRTASEHPATARHSVETPPTPVFSSQQRNAVFPSLSTACQTKPSRAFSDHADSAFLHEDDDSAFPSDSKETPPAPSMEITEEESACAAEETEPQLQAVLDLGVQTPARSPSPRPSRSEDSAKEERPGWATALEIKNSHEDYISLMFFWFELLQRVADEEKRVASLVKEEVEETAQTPEVPAEQLLHEPPRRIATSNTLKFLAEIMQSEAEMCRIILDEYETLEKAGDVNMPPSKVRQAREAYMASMKVAEAALQAYIPSAWRRPSS